MECDKARKYETNANGIIPHAHRCNLLYQFFSGASHWVHRLLSVREARLEGRRDRRARSRGLGKVRGDGQERGQGQWTELGIGI